MRNLVRLVSVCAAVLLLASLYVVLQGIADTAGNGSGRPNVVSAASLGQPPAPQALSPGIPFDADAVIGNLTPPLFWSDVPEATSYAVAISKFPYGGSNIIYRNEFVFSTSITVPAGFLEPGTRYRWNVQARNAAGTLSLPSNLLYFQTPVVNARIDSFSPSSRQEVEVGQSVILAVTFTNTGGLPWKFVSGATVWNSLGQVVANYEFTEVFDIQPGASTTRAWSHPVTSPGDYWVQFGVWKQKPFISENLLDRKPSPSQNLFSGVAPPPLLSVSPTSGLSSSGPQAGPFSPSSQLYTLTNTGGSGLSWSASTNQPWVSVSHVLGSLGPGDFSNVNVFLDSTANSLPPGIHTATVFFTNNTNGQGSTTRMVTLDVSAPPPPPRFTLTINCDGTGSVNPQGCDTTQSYDRGTQVTLIPSPASGWEFSGWSGACSGTGSCQVTMDANKSVTATFTQLVPEPVITSSLTIDPTPPYVVGQTLTARFTITNKGTAPITFTKLTAGGRLDGVNDCSNTGNVCPDFTHALHVTLNPGESYSYQGTFTPTLPGTYDLQVFYDLGEDDWHWNVPTDSGVTNSTSITVSLPEPKKQFHDAFTELLEVFKPFDPLLPIDELRAQHEASLKAIEEAEEAARQISGSTEATRTQIDLSDLGDLLLDLHTLKSLLEGTIPHPFIPPLIIPEGCPLIISLCFLDGGVKRFDASVSQQFDFTLSVPIEKSALELFEIFKPGDRFVTDFHFLGVESSFSTLEVINVLDTPEFGVLELAIEGVNVVGVCGDLNKDGKVDIIDIVLTLQIAAGMAESTPAQEILGDLIHDGVINVFDAVALIQHVTGLTPALDGCVPK